MQSHEIDYTIIGNELQAVEIELDPGETVIAEAGAMASIIDIPSLTQCPPRILRILRS